MEGKQKEKRWFGFCTVMVGLHLDRQLGNSLPLPSARQHPSYGGCLEVEREYYQNCSVLDCVTQCSQSAAHCNVLSWTLSLYTTTNTTR